MRGNWDGGRKRTSLWGLFLVILGAWWLLGELGYVRFEWAWAGPLAIIIAGLSMILRGSAWGGCCYGGDEHRHSHEPPKSP